MKYKNLNYQIAIGIATMAVLLSACGGKNAQGEPEKAEPVEEATTETVVQEPAEEVEGSAPESETATVSEEEALPGLPETLYPNAIIKLDDGSYVVADNFSKKILTLKDGETTVLAGADTVEDIFEVPSGGYSDDVCEKAMFAEPWGLTPFIGGVAVSDAANGAVRLIKDGTVETINGSLDGTGAMLTYKRPTGITVDEKGNLYICDTLDDKIYGITPEGVASVVFKNLGNPTALVYKSGTLYVAETGSNRISMITATDGNLLSGNASKKVIAGTGDAGFEDGSVEEATFSSPQGLAIGNDGALYVADTLNGAIRKISQDKVETILQAYDDEIDTFPVSPVGLLIEDHTMYICDNYAGKIYSVSLE
ncbi:MAG: hypothetical protein E7302_11630 [Butyrivibrio sp.]|nr:hypothetical protein [Butyrivibrio sp.]